MTRAVLLQTPAPPPGRLAALRDARLLRWLGYRASYVVGVPVLALLGLLTTLYIPRLISPTEFGAYSLLLNVYRYAGRGDLGLSQLADRLVAGRAGDHDVARILDARFRLGVLTLLIVVPIAAMAAYACHALSPLDTALAAAAGTCAMMAAGPASIYRARGQVWEYTFLSFLFGVGFMVPRLAGIYLGGVTGCFVALLLWYVAVLMAFPHRFRRSMSGRRGGDNVLRTLRVACPLFVFAAVWTVYLSANRWVAAALSSPHQLGLFSLGANLSLAGITTLASIGDIRYPYWLRRLAQAAPRAESKAVEWEALAMALSFSIAAAICIPLVPPTIARIFPAYAGSGAAVVALGIASIPLAIVAWFLPVVIAASTAPLRDTLFVFIPATLVLIAGMIIGDRLGGIAGQGWGCCASSMAALAGLAFSMWRIAILRPAAAARVVLLPMLMLVPLGGLAFATNPRGKPLTLETASRVEGPPPGWRLAFEDRFDRLRLWDGQQPGWEPHYPWGGRTNPTANEREYYVDPRSNHELAPLGAFNPYSVGQEGLTISARPLPPSAQAALKRLAYASGLLNSLHLFTFTYGYVELRAIVPRGRGLWSAFWLLPVRRIWPPEIDIMEVIGDEDHRYWATLHEAEHQFEQSAIKADGLYDTPHDYGLRWDADRIAWFFDGKRVATTQTPPGFHQPMYMLLNLAVGGDWPGEPNAATHFPARMIIRRIRVFQPDRPAEPEPEP